MGRVSSEQERTDVYRLGKRYCLLFSFDFVHYLIFNIKHFGYICFFYNIVLRYFFFALPFPLLAIAVPFLPMEGAEWVQQTECGKHVFESSLPDCSSTPPHCTALALWLSFSAFHGKPNSLCRKAVGVLCLIREYECRIKTI